MEKVQKVMILTVFICLFNLCFSEEEYCNADSCQGIDKKRYIIYDINTQEGFNLRKDVYVRLAVMAKQFTKSQDHDLNNIILVLPPFSHLRHWAYNEEPEHLPWSTFFDVQSLQQFAPVIEMYELFELFKQNGYSKLVINQVYVLQHYEEMFKTGKFSDKWEIEKCTKPPRLNYFYYENVTSHKVQCLSFCGHASQLKGILKKDKSRVIMFDHAEIPLHDYYGKREYWQALRSMRFSKKLKQIADKYRQSTFNSNDVSDNTVLPDYWREEQPRRNALGGSYLAVHIRRGDFAYRIEKDPALHVKNIAEQISKKLDELKLKDVFVASDGSEEELNVLRKQIGSKYYVHYYEPENILHDGEVAIIDQIICAHAKWFIGTHQSTFTLRIYEMREILGFPPDTTFNGWCVEAEKCEKPTRWLIEY